MLSQFIPWPWHGVIERGKAEAAKLAWKTEAPVLL